MTSSLDPGSPSVCDLTQQTPASAWCPDNAGPTASSSSSASTHDGDDLTTMWYEAENGGSAIFLRNGVTAEESMISEAWTAEHGQPSLVMDGSGVHLDQSGRAAHDSNNSEALFLLMSNTDLNETAVEALDEMGKWYDAPGNLGTEHSEHPPEKGAVDFDNQKHVLVEMGFSESEVSSALVRSQSSGGGILEAANVLAEQAEQQESSPGLSISELVTDLFISSSSFKLKEMYKPGKYRILVEQTTSSSTGGNPQGSLVEGEVVDIEDVNFPAAEWGWIRGRMVDGRWINIHFFCKGRKRVWAKPLSLETQLIEIGFPPETAREAARRCSSAEAAVEFIINNLD
mmetsp:Transcript_111870/g.222362  ORF Transcript_111870/g.222362 Transcript_111870/m.222362 type:complete len:343 (-) Transcript_111870:249-1277(-)